MTRADLARHFNLLAHKVALFLERTCFWSSGKNERVLQARNIQFQGPVFRCQRAVHNRAHLCRREPCIVNRFWNKCRVEGFTLLRVNCRLAFHQINIRMTNAIQAFQGLFGPFGSKPSYHAVDSGRGPDHLR